MYIDLDVDLNPPEAASDGALELTGVAHLLDLPGAESLLSSLGPRRPMLAPRDILFFGVDNITPPEAASMKSLSIEPIMLGQVKRDPAGAARVAIEWGARYDRLLVHLDVDVLAFVDFRSRRTCVGAMD